MDPKDVNFSQRSVSPHNNGEKMMITDPDHAKYWDWEGRQSHLRVMDMNGQLVSYDNRRLDGARHANANTEGGYRVPVERVNADDPYPGKKYDTWGDAFNDRRHDDRNRGPNGEPVPETGLNERPEHAPSNQQRGYPGR